MKIVMNFFLKHFLSNDKKKSSRDKNYKTFEKLDTFACLNDVWKSFKCPLG